MHMKSFGAGRKHARGRPLLRPKSDFRQNSLVTSDKFTENSAMTLRMDCARENLHAGNPGALYLRARPVCFCQFACRNTWICDSLRQRAQFIIARSQCISCRLAHAQPQTCFAFIHISLFKSVTCLARNPRVREKDLDCNKDRHPERQPNVAPLSPPAMSILPGASCQ